MSIPGLFAPVYDGDRVYVDGGLIGNLPTDVVRKMGADIVIAVHLDVATAESKQVQSVFGVLGRAIDVVIRDNEIRGMADADLIVNVNLRAYNSLDYNKGEAIVGIGAGRRNQSGFWLPIPLMSPRGSNTCKRGQRASGTRCPSPSL
jgi:NTE family protein